MNDLMFAGGRVLDPGEGIDTVTDLSVSGGVVSALGESETALQTVDALSLIHI